MGLGAEGFQLADHGGTHPRSSPAADDDTTSFVRSGWTHGSPFSLIW